MFLFHQPVSETYYLATRRDWWAYPTPFYWFSPYPIPIHIWEFPIVIALVILLSVLMDRYVNKWLIDSILATTNFVTLLLREDSKEEADDEMGDDYHHIMIKNVVSKLAGVEVDPDMGLAEVGISSTMATILVSQINTKLSSQRTRRSNVRISVTDLTSMDIVRDLISFVGGKLNKDMSDIAESTLSIDRRDFTVGDIESVETT